MNAVLRKMTASDAVAVFLRAAEKMEPRIARAFIAAIEAIRTRIPAENLARMIERRDFTSLENAFSAFFTSEEWAQYRAAIEQAVLEGVRATSETQGIINGAQEDFQIAVGLNPRLSQFAVTMTSTRIREIDQSIRDTVRQVLRTGLTDGDDPFAIARRVRNSVGLTRRQEAAVSNYERMLRALDPEALDRKLRDRRSDGTVERAIRNDKLLTEAQIRSLVNRYRDRYVKYRANVISRTESIRAVQGAQWELFQDMINKGQIDARQVRRTWINTGDDHVRNSHVEIPLLNPRGVGQSETFTSPLGPILYPGDPSATAANTIQCRCAVFSRIIDRNLLPASLGAQIPQGKPRQNQ
jgi:predicted transcriptional regulator